MGALSFKNLAALLLTLLAAFLIWNWLGNDGEGGRRRGGSDPEAEDAVVLPEMEPLRIGMLDPETTGYDVKQSRNLFLYTTPPPDPAELERRRKAAEEAERKRLEQQRLAEERRKKLEEERKRRLAEQAAEAEDAAEELAKNPPPPKPPEIRLSYVGYVGPMRDRVAVMMDEEGELVIGKEGEVVQDDFRILRIGFTYLEIGYVNFDGSKPLPLGEGRRPGGRG